MRLSSKGTFVEFEPKLSVCRNQENKTRDGQPKKQIRRWRGIPCKIAMELRSDEIYDDAHRQLYAAAQSKRNQLCYFILAAIASRISLRDQPTLSCPLRASIKIAPSNFGLSRLSIESLKRRTAALRK